MTRTLAALALGAWFSTAAMAQMTPVGLWQTIDDKDGTVIKVMSTGVGSAGSPYGLAQFSAYTQEQTK